MAWTRKLASGNYQTCWRQDDGSVRTKTFPRKADAERHRSLVEADQIRGVYHDPAAGRLSLEQWWVEELPRMQATLRASTMALYADSWRRFIQPALGGRELAKIQRYDVMRFMDDMQARGVGTEQRKTVLRVVKRMLAQAVKAERIGRNPALDISQPKAPKTERRFLELDEIEQLLLEIPDRWRCFVELALYGGLRLSEIAALRQHRVDFLHRVVRIEEAAVGVGGRVVFGRTKSERPRAVKLPKTVIDHLAQHVTLWPPADDGRLFSGASGQPVKRENFYKHVWWPALKRSELGRVPFHSLRHTYGAMAIKAGASAKALQTAMGHASITTTLNTYGHLMKGLDDDIADALDAWVPERPEGPLAAGLLLERRRTRRPYTRVKPEKVG